MAINDFLRLLAQERARQDAMFGVQTHSGHCWAAILVEEVGEFVKAVNDGDCELAMTELIQVAAVAQAAWEMADEGRGELEPTWGTFSGSESEGG